jgi:hypothetical protein
MGKPNVNIANPAERPVFAASVPPSLIVEIDEAGTFTYISRALPGTGTDAAGWQIQRITAATGSSRWADGNNKFDKIADDRATYTYS